MDKNRPYLIINGKPQRAHKIEASPWREDDQELYTDRVIYRPLCVRFTVRRRLSHMWYEIATYKVGSFEYHQRQEARPYYCFNAEPYDIEMQTVRSIRQWEGYNYGKAETT